MSDNAVQVERLGKQYRLGGKAEPYFTLRDSLSRFGAKIAGAFSKNGRGRSQDTLFWALKDVSFQVRHGEVIGIIGRNGAGKSTLLRILSRITEPTEGWAEIRGRIASLLEVGTGFHPELTGRENIFLSGAVLGMRRAEITKKFDEIVAFAEVEKFIDTPVKRFSSGMHLRLAFGVAAYLEPDTLLVDEVLAVGDANFQKKCLGKMGEVAREGRTVLFVSHQMGAIQRLCSRVLYLDHGKVVKEGPVEEVISEYLGEGESSCAERTWTDTGRAPGDQVVRISAVRVKDSKGRVSGECLIHDPIDIEIEFSVLSAGDILEVDVYLLTEQGVVVFISKGEYGNAWRHRQRPVGLFQETCRIPGDFLNEGRFTIHVGIVTPPWTVHASAQDVVSFKVVDDFSGGARGSYPREWPRSAVRPILRWTARHLSGEE